MKQKVYDVRISRTPYNAMCIDIFESNEEGKIYNTKEYVEFKGQNTF